MKLAKRIGVIGSHEPDYPRHLVLEASLRLRGFDLIVRSSRAPFPFRHFFIARYVLTLPLEVKVLYVTEGAHRLMPLIKFWAVLTGRKVLFDPFLSRYNTRVEDRKLYSPGSLQAWIAHWQDWSSCKAADYLIFDTHEHRDYFYDRYNLKVPSEVVPVGVPEDTFHFPLDVQPATTSFDVLFYGTFIPLQGIETIVKACEYLGDEEVSVTVIGKGQTYDAVMSVAQSKNLPESRLKFLPPVPFESLPHRLATSHVALGIFGDTQKARRVVPNKVVQAAAMGRPIVTADTPAIRRYFEHGVSVFLVPIGDSQALARALLTLKNNPAMCAKLGEGARRVFEAEFSLNAIGQKMTEAVGVISNR